MQVEAPIQVVRFVKTMFSKMDQTAFINLRRDCASALASYMAEAQIMYEMFASCVSVTAR